ncbi:hypothetical protein AMAG_14006 [Allomyces macrogynus ATCC 38327]|uniref:G domain-containing protein n=1 Tax=Allomyces macrogynus (strain ATCC 38327) TaxID=578462 RepID=A0A0L0T3L7_ALLM3|nr:hypothetical protein AMAG_14006 [Allomyces macrogynus ATCC 38327]|eukprot:KNE69149.1 hypothetical protein AMAG_14006 [Allomyces macrogynus ATCC 38327]
MRLLAPICYTLFHFPSHLQPFKNVTTADLQETVLFIGNPGTGKTTLINSVAGKIISKAGPVFVGGIMFDDSQYTVVDGIKWVNTPGLPDIKQCKLGAKGIIKTLKQPGHYRLIFVFTEYGSCVNPLDLATLETVLNAIDQEDIPFGVIFNKISPKKMKRFVCDLADKLRLLTFINSGSYQTEHVYLARCVDEARDMDDIILSDDFIASIKAFIAQVPKIDIRPDMIKDFDTSTLSYSNVQRIEELAAKQMEQLYAQMEMWQ